ncbi:hypothetical protein TSUD_108890 [Trifolium subterraneum]|nr:hypothetical protein TSUD_108890 [Trifolium subterraneum]
MSSGVESVSGEVGSVGTNGFDDVGDDAFGAGACFGDATGAVATAAMLGEYNEENMSRKSKLRIWDQSNEIDRGIEF